MALALGHLGDLLEGEGEKVEALYRRMREYTGWFEESFGSTLCRDRCGADLRRASGFADYILGGKFLTRCVAHIGKAVEKLIGMINLPLEGGRRGTGADGAAATGVRASSESTGSWGLCAAPVLRRIRQATGRGSRLLEDISISLDGGIGLSGGLCGALAGALLPLGEVWGIDPKEEGIAGTLLFFARGHLNLYAGRGKKGLWAVGTPLLREFRRRFGSLECREITGRDFGSRKELEGHLTGSAACGEIRDWCVEETVGLLGGGHRMLS